MLAAFPKITTLPPDPLFGLMARFNADPRDNKVALGIGAYRDNSGKPWILPLVRAAEAALQKDPGYNHEYLPIAGYAPFTKAAAGVILGKELPALVDERVVTVQLLLGTGALHVAGKFLKQFYAGEPVVYLLAPTWANHNQIFEVCGFKIATYPYWNSATKLLDLAGYLAAIESAPRGLIFLLHACAHNPTGLDPTQEQWGQILDRLEQGNHLMLFDLAYQGFASGSLEKDGWAVREAVRRQKERGLAAAPILICQLFAKNVGMYGERTGAVHVLVPPGLPAELKEAVLNQLQKITRLELSNPPAYGAKVVLLVLTQPELYAQWEQDLVTMLSRIAEMRKALFDELTRLGTPGSWTHIVEQQGMFSFTGLTAEQVDRLEKEHAIYLVSSGRASIAGLNEGNVKVVAQAINEVVRRTKL